MGAAIDCHLARRRPRRGRGSTLIEALVAFLVVSVGMVTVARTHVDLRLGADVARQRSQAVRIAQQDLEALRAFAAATGSAPVTSFDAIAGVARDIDAVDGTRFQLVRRIDGGAAPHAKHASVRVGWSDRRGGAHAVELDTIIDGSDPALRGALGLARAGGSARGSFARSAAIPLEARDLGDGRSAFKPVSNGTVAVVFDNATGAVVARCGGVDPALAMRALTAAALGGCDARAAIWISGSVRFSSASPPDPARADDVPLALAVAATPGAEAGTAAPECAVESLKTVSYTALGTWRIESVALDAVPASLGLADWVDTGERHLAYRCVVDPGAGGRWSGRVTLDPVGWTLGAGAGDRRVCRYSSDLDGSGAIDANIEHPADYAGVDGPLANQDFLVIRGTESCPGTTPVDVAGAAPEPFVDLATVPHQP